MAYFPASDSVVAFQSNPSALQVLATVTNPTSTVSVVFPTNQNVSGSVVSFQGTTPWLIGSVYGNMSGSVVSFQGTTPWLIGSVYGNVSGSVATTQLGTWNTSITSTVPSSVIVGASIFGQLPAGTAVLGSVATLQGTNPWVTVNSAGSVTATNQVAGSVLNVNVSGSVAAFQGGNRVTSLVSTVPSSVIVGASIFGQLPAGTAVLGSVATLQGTNPWTTVHSAGSITSITIPAGSVLNANISGSVAAVRTGQLGTVMASIAGTYAAGAASVVSALGLLRMGVRNDTLASTLGDTTYQPTTLGPVGETITANAPITKWISGSASLLTAVGGSIIAIAAPGAGVFQYITGIQFSGFGSQSVLLTVAAGLNSTGSTIGRYVVPAGGSNSAFMLVNGIKTGPNTAITTSIGGSAAITSSVYVAIQGFTSTT